MKRRNSSCKQP